MLTLAIETSQRIGGVALFEGERLLEERVLGMNNRHAQDLLPEIRDLFHSHGRKPENCNQVAVGIGPGSFTGLRVGVVCAKVWCYASNSQLLAVPSLLGVARRIPVSGVRLWTILDAQRGELFVEQFQTVEEQWQSSSPVEIMKTSDFLARLAPTDLVTGQGVEKFASERTMNKLQDQITNPIEEPLRWPSAATTGMIGLEMATQGAFSSPWDLVPNYGRKSAAEEKKEGAIP